MSVLCNIMTLIDCLQHIILFVIVRCRQMKKLKKAPWFGVSKLKGAQNTDTVAQKCFMEIAI